MRDRDKTPSLSARRQRRKHRERSALAGFSLSFGRYRNTPLCEVPAEYLRWVLMAENVPDADRWVVEQFLQTVVRPRQRGPGRCQETPTPAAGTVGAGKPKA